MHSPASHGRRWPALCLILAVAAGGGLVTLHAAQKPPPEEEDRNQKPLRQPPPEEEDTARKIDREAAPLPALARELERTTQPEVQDLYRELLYPHDVVTLTDGTPLIVVPIHYYLGRGSTYTGNLPLKRY